MGSGLRRRRVNPPARATDDAKSDMPLLKELYMQPQPMILCHENTLRPQYSIALKSYGDSFLDSQTYKQLSFRCSVDASKTTADKVVVAGVTEAGTDVSVSIVRGNALGDKTYLATVTVG